MSSRLSQLALLVAVGAFSLCLTGCSDMLTHAGDSRDAGLDAYNAGDYPKAAGAFRNAVKQDPRDYRSHYWLGMSAIQMQNYQQAIVAFRSCLDTRNVTITGREDDETAIKALDGLAQAIVASDDGDLEVNKVEQEARSAQGPKAAQEFFILAKVYRYRRLPDMALDYYNRACLANTRNFYYQKEAGLYAEQLQQNAKAGQNLRQAYALNSSDAEVTAALQRLGVVPGLSLKDKNDLAKPLMPKGPIPEVKVGSGQETPTRTPGTSTNTNTAATPRD